MGLQDDACRFRWRHLEVDAETEAAPRRRSSASIRWAFPGNRGKSVACRLPCRCAEWKAARFSYDRRRPSPRRWTTETRKCPDSRARCRESGPDAARGSSAAGRPIKRERRRRASPGGECRDDRCSGTTGRSLRFWYEMAICPATSRRWWCRAPTNPRLDRIWADRRQDRRRRGRASRRWNFPAREAFPEPSTRASRRTSCRDERWIVDGRPKRMLRRKSDRFCLRWPTPAAGRSSTLEDLCRGRSRWFWCDRRRRAANSPTLDRGRWSR